VAIERAERAFRGHREATVAVGSIPIRGSWGVSAPTMSLTSMTMRAGGRAPALRKVSST
jgi:hypothetical protein